MGTTSLLCGRSYGCGGSCDCCACNFVLCTMCCCCSCRFVLLSQHIPALAEPKHVLNCLSQDSCCWFVALCPWLLPVTNVVELICIDMLTQIVIFTHFHTSNHVHLSRFLFVYVCIYTSKKAAVSGRSSSTVWVRKWLYPKNDYGGFPLKADHSWVVVILSI